jgi:hypothetical protein
VPVGLLITQRLCNVDFSAVTHSLPVDVWMRQIWMTASLLVLDATLAHTNRRKQWSGGVLLHDKQQQVPACMCRLVAGVGLFKGCLPGHFNTLLYSICWRVL